MGRFCSIKISMVALSSTICAVFGSEFGLISVFTKNIRLFVLYCIYERRIIVFNSEGSNNVPKSLYLLVQKLQDFGQ